MHKNEVIVQNEIQEDWIVHLVNTGLESNTGGRVVACVITCNETLCDLR
jgi:hypothetical protein